MPKPLPSLANAFKAAFGGFQQGSGGSAPSGLFGSGSGGGSGLMQRPQWFGDGRHRGSDRIWTNAEEINYRAKVGDITNNNAVLCCLMWLMRNYPSAPVKVKDRKTKKVMEDHPLENLLLSPAADPLISYSTMSASIVMSYWGNGNAYLFKVRNKNNKLTNPRGAVTELWYRPHWMVKPVREKGSNNFIDYYLYKPDDMTPAKPIPREDVVHLRFGSDPDNEMLGMSPLKALLKTVFTEQEANSFLASILTNLGVVGAIVTHKPEWHSADAEGEGAFSTLSDEEGRAIKNNYKEEFSAGKRGSMLLLDGDFEVDFPQIAVNADLAEKAKKISQADIAASFGIPPAIVGFLVGLEHQDARAAHESMLRQAYVSCLCPMQRDNASDLERQLLPDFELRDRDVNGRLLPTRGTVFYDYTDVPAMQESQDAVTKRWLEIWKATGCTRAQLLQALNIKSEKGQDDVYFLAKGSLIVPKDISPDELFELLSACGTGPPDDPANDDDPKGKDPPTEKEPKPKGKDQKP